MLWRWAVTHWFADKLIVIHGAGSFGHMEAKYVVFALFCLLCWLLCCVIRSFIYRMYGVQGGFKNSNFKQTVIDGMAKTRRSVTKLNGNCACWLTHTNFTLAIVINKLIEAGLPAVGVSPFCSWKTNDGVVVKHNIAELKEMLDADLIPVLHGDVVLYVKKPYQHVVLRMPLSVSTGREAPTNAFVPTALETSDGCLLAANYVL